ncbi:hypothetical protein [Parasulfitobacter algicola]|uniref:Uncharacterized protein n=1 Tax=Parasulfitobacter algicola TaxID=2614809 RepID=A0ABX2IMM0_9RHOB|nr:hypothetical protein [Sulfitobacter algicola]NSX54123.1 hypothetical protein [Sulfitobacter algicola]
MSETLYYSKKQMSLTRRKTLLLGGAGVLATQVPTIAMAEGLISGPIAQASSTEFEAIVAALQNERASISLANESYLRERCQETLNALSAAIDEAERAVSTLRNETGSARNQALASSLGAIVSAIGLRLALAAAAGVTAPVSVTAAAVGLRICTLQAVTTPRTTCRDVFAPVMTPCSHVQISTLRLHLPVGYTTAANCIPMYFDLCWNFDVE